MMQTTAGQSHVDGKDQQKVAHREDEILRFVVWCAWLTRCTDFGSYVVTKVEFSSWTTHGLSHSVYSFTSPMTQLQVSRWILSNFPSSRQLLQIPKRDRVQVLLVPILTVTLWSNDSRWNLPWSWSCNGKSSWQFSEYREDPGPRRWCFQVWYVGIQWFGAFKKRLAFEILMPFVIGCFFSIWCLTFERARVWHARTLGDLCREESSLMYTCCRIINFW